MEKKMYTKEKPLPDRLVDARLALTNALGETEIKEALKELGFDETKLQTGMQLLERVENLYRQQKREYSTQYAATEEFNKVLLEAEMVYRKYKTAARLALLDAPAHENSLGLNRGPIFNIPEWLTQARLFYSGALKSPEVLEKLKEFAITAENLQAGLDLVNKAQEFHNRQQVESSEAKQATRERNAAAAELDLFMRKFNKVAWVLLAEKPKYLEKLGIPEYYGRARRKKQDAEPAEPKPAEPGNTKPAVAKSETAAVSPDVQEVPAVSEKNRQPVRLKN
jgi:hypothetical protein